MSKKIYKRNIAKALGLGLFLVPSVTYAQSPDLSYIEDALQALADLVAQLIPLVIAIGLLFFIWGLVQFIIASGDEDAKEVGKRRMVWGVFALFVMVSVWGLVQIVADMVGAEVGGTIDIPTVDLN